MNNIFSFLKSASNPQQLLQNIMGNNSVMQNPIAKNAFEMYQKGDTKGLESMARNLCNEKGINADEAIKQIKSQFGM